MVETKAVNRVIRFTEKKPFWIFTDDKIFDYSSLNIWLTTNGTDFNNEFKINEISKDQVVVLTKNPNIEYFQFTRSVEGRNYYYYKTNTKFISNDIYQLDFELDWYATYFLDIASNFYSKKMYIKRSHDVLQNPFTSCVIEDEKLEEIVPVNTDLNFIEDDILTFNFEGKNYYGVNGKDYYDFSTFRFGNVYAVWKASVVDNSLGYKIMPITTQPYKDSSDMFIYLKATNKKYGFNNCFNNVRVINKNTNWANGFVGIFTGPGLMREDALVYQVNGVLSKTLFYNTFVISYFQEYNITKTFLNYSGNEALKLNYKNGLYSPNILNYYDFKIGNSKLDALNFEIQNNKFKIKDGYISFNENSFVFYNNLKFEDFKDIVKTYPGALMSESKPYLQYVEQNRNRINTSLAIGASSMVGSIATKNPIAIGAGILSGVKSIAGIKSNLKDKKRELVDKPNASYDNDNAFYILFGLLKNIKSTPLVYYRNLENIEKFNNQIVYYGWKQEKYLIPNIVIDNERTHFYLQIDANDFFLQNQALFNKIPFIYWDNVINMLNNGIRLWKGDVNYKYA